MIVRVAAALRFPQTRFFDYDAPGMTLARGAVVDIPFHGRLVPAVVWACDPADAHTGKLKSVQAVHFAGTPVFSEATLALLENIALHYQTSLSLFLLYLLPRFPKRAPPTAALATAMGAAGRATVVQVKNLFTEEAMREATIDGDIPTLVLAPTVAHVAWLKAFLKRALPKKRLATFDSKLTPKNQVGVWSSLASGEMDILLATRSGVLAPLPANGRIVLFAEEEPSFVQFDAEPRYDARLLARTRAAAESRGLVTLTEALPLLALASADEKRLLEETNPLCTINLTDARRGGFYGILEDSLLEAAREALQTGKNVVVCVNRKGSAMVLRCGACLKAISCETCEIPMRAFEMMRCGRCGRTEPIPTSCPSCGSTKIRKRGVTIDAVRDALRLAFPDVPTRIVATAEDLPPDREHPMFLLGTEMLVHSLRPLLERVDIGAVLVPSAEQLFGNSSYTDTEHGYALLRGLQALAETHSAAFLLQTYEPTHPILQAFEKKPSDVVAELLEERKTFDYPPFVTLGMLHAEEMPTIDLADAATAALRDAGLSLATVIEMSRSSVLVRVPAKDELSHFTKQLPPAWRWEADPRSFSS